jgi:hypothetical protein
MFRDSQPQLVAPWTPESTVIDARNAYLAENGFTVAGYSAKTAEVSVLGLSFCIPNPPTRQRAIAIHDLHHVATGYGTDFKGEAEVSAFECAHSLSGIGIYVQMLVIGIALGGLCFAPIRTVRAFRAGRRARNSLYTDPTPYAELTAMRVVELRAYLGVPATGLASGRRGHHAKAPGMSAA